MKNIATASVSCYAKKSIWLKKNIIENVKTCIFWCNLSDKLNDLWQSNNYWAIFYAKYSCMEFVDID